MNRKWKILSAIGGILIFIGLIILFSGIVPTGPLQTEIEEIPGGYCIFFYTTSQVSSGSLSGSYEVTPGSIELYIMTQDQFRNFSLFGSTDSRYSDSGYSGEFSASLAETGIYYIVVDHSPGYTYVDQTITLEYRLSGLMWTPVLIGIVLIAVGAVMAVWGFRANKQEVIWEEPSICDVTFFEDESASDAPMSGPALEDEPRPVKTRTVRKMSGSQPPIQ